jgi:hypothetical protein
MADTDIAVDIDALIASNRAAVDELFRTAEAAAAENRWTTPRAPGKWSPQQVVEHVATSLEEAGNVIAGRPTKLPTMPALLRPIGGLLFRRVLKKGGFPKVKTPPSMDPAKAAPAGPATIDEARARLDAGFAAFERACRERAAKGDAVPSRAFGNVSLADYARFNELHTRHHTRQIPVVL